MALVGWDELDGSKKDREENSRAGRTGYSPATEKEDVSFSPFDQLAAGFSAGIDQEQALFGAAKAGYGSLTNDAEMTQAGLDYYREQMAEADENAPLSSFDDVDGLASAGNFIAYTLGNAIPSLATTVVGGGIGGAAAKVVAKKVAKDSIEESAKLAADAAAKDIVEEALKNKINNAYKEQVANKYARLGVGIGGAVPATGLAFGENFARIYEETGLEDPGAALVSGLFSGALDSMGAPFRALKLAFPDNPRMLTNLKEHIADQALTSDGRKRFGKMMTEGFKAAGQEGLTEATQEFLTRSAVLWAKESLPEDQQQMFNNYLFNEEARSNYLHAAVAGGIVGKAVGVGTGAFQSIDAPNNQGKTLDLTNEKVRQEKLLEAKKIVSDVFDAPLEADEESGIPMVPEVEFDANLARLTDTLETIEFSAGITRDELAKDNGLSTDQQQEMLDTLLDQGRIKAEVSGNNILYTIADDADDQAVAQEPPVTETSDVQEPAAITTIEAEGTTETSTQTLEEIREQAVTEEPEAPPTGRINPSIGDQVEADSSGAQEPTISSPTGPIEDNRSGREDPVVGALTDENRVIAKPTVKNTLNGIGIPVTEVSFPDSGTTYQMKEYAADAGGGWYLASEDLPELGVGSNGRPNVDLGDNKGSAVQTLADIERQRASTAVQTPVTPAPAQPETPAPQPKLVIPIDRSADVPDQVMALVETLDDFSIADVTRGTDLRLPQAKQVLSQLETDGRVEVVKGGRYRVIRPEPQVQEDTGQEGSTSRVTDPDANPKQKRNSDNPDTETDLTFPDGDVRTIRKDGEFWYDAETDLELGDNKREAVQAIKDIRREEFAASGGSVQEAPATQELRVKDPSLNANKSTKKDENFEQNGEHIVSFSDGDKRRMFYDAQSSGWYDAEKPNGLEGYLGGNKKDALERFKSIREDEFDSYDMVRSPLQDEGGLAGDLAILRDGRTNSAQNRSAFKSKPKAFSIPVAGATHTDNADDGVNLPERIRALNENIGQPAQQLGGTNTFVTQKVPNLGALVRHLSGIGESPVVGKEDRTGVTTLNPMLESLGIDDVAVDRLLQDSPESRRLMNTLVDIFERGMPADTMDKILRGIYSADSEGTALPSDALGMYFPRTNSLGISPQLIQDAARDAVAAKGLMGTIAHEMWHAQDKTKGYTQNLPSLFVGIRQGGGIGSPLSVELGDVTAELFDAWDSGSELGQVFNYPLTYLQVYLDTKDGNLVSLSETIKKEMFAQLGAIYITDPALLENGAPKAYKMMQDIQRDPRSLEELLDADSTVQETDTATQREGLSGEVRSPAGTGVVQVPDDGGVGGEGRGGGQEGAADSRMGEPVVGQDGDDIGRSLLDDVDLPDFIVESKKYLYQKSKGKVTGKAAITKVIGPKNADKQLPALDALSARHTAALDSPAAWLKFERDLTGSNETLRPPHGLIKFYNNPEEWASVHSKLSGEQLEAAREGLNTAKELGKLYEDGEVTPDVTAKLMLWGMMSRMLTASAQEAGFVDMVFSAQGQNRSTFEDFADKALSGSFTDADIAEWKDFVPTAITEGSFGRAGTSNANDFGKFLQKMSEMDDSGVTKLQRLHDLIADRSISSIEVRRQFQGMADNIGIDNKVFSFLLLMTGRDDVVILDRIQLNTMWDSGRYGKLIYDDIADNFNGLHGLARYEALENALKSRIQGLYTAIGRPDEASVGRYHWESWVLNSGQVVAHPTMQGIVNDVRGESSPYAFLGAPEGKQNMFRYGSIYARDPDGTQYFLYSDSKGERYRLDKQSFSEFIQEIRKPKHDIIPRNFKVSEYDKGFPWYEADGVNRENLDRLLESYAERKATPVEYGVKETIQDGDTDVSGQELDTSDTVEAIDEPLFALASVPDPEDKGIKPFQLSDDIAVDVNLETRLKGLVSQNVRQKVVDRLERLKEAENQIAKSIGLERLPSELSAYDAENLMHSKAQSQLESFEEQYVVAIVEQVKAAGLDIDQVGLYLLAKHAPERNRVIAKKEQDLRAKQIEGMQTQIERAEEAGDPTESLEKKLEILENAPFKYQSVGSGMTDQDAASVLMQAREDGKIEILDDVADRVYAMLDDMRENMVSKGLLDDDTRNDWEDTYSFYVPLKGFASYPEGMEIKGNVAAAGFNIRGSESFKAKGRITLPVNPLLVAFKDAEEKIIRAERNVIAQRLLALLSANKSPDNWNIWNNKNRPTDPNNPAEQMSLERMKSEVRKDDGMAKYIQVKRGGQTFFVEVKDRELNRQLQSSGVGMFNGNVDVLNKVLTGLQQFQNFRRNMLINYNPSWGLVNPMRDIQTGLAFALSEQDVVGGRIQGEELIGKISYGYKASLQAFWRSRRGKEGVNDAAKEYDQYTKEYIEDGAPTGMSMTKSLAEQSARFDRILKQGDLKKKLYEVADFVEDYNQTMENAVRLSTYVEARKAGTARADAATLAKDLTVNFNRKGEYSSAVDSLYLFFNAAVQGNVNIAKAILRPSADGRALTKARLYAGSMVSLGFALTLMNIDFGGEDDDGEPNYADFNEYALKTGILITNPWSEGDSLSIPMPYGYGLFHNIGRYAAELSMGVKTAEEVAVDFASSIDHHFNPMSLHAAKDTAGTLDMGLQKGIGFLPDIAQHFVEQIGNINFFGSDIKIPQNSFLTPKPPSEPTKRGTNEYISAATRWVNDVTGGSEYRTGSVSANPEQIQHLFEFLMGGVGRFLGDSSDTIAKIISEEPDLRRTDLPILRTFLPMPSEYSDRMDFYRNRDEFAQAADEFDDSDREGRLALEEELGYRVSQFKLIDKRIDKKLRKLSKEKKKLEANPIIDPLLRYERIEIISSRQELLYDEYNMKYKELTK